MDDNSLMPFGEHEGKKLANVPAHYLIWLFDNDRAGRVKRYIENNLDALREEVKRKEKAKN